MTIARFAALAAAAGVAALFAAPAQAVTFAQFEVAPNTTTPNFVWVNTTGTGGTLTTIGSAPVQFSFLNDPSLGIDNVAANLTFTGTVDDTAAINAGGYLVQPGLDGSFEFSLANAMTIGGKTYAAGTDLLSGAFQNAEISGQVNASAGNVDAATSAGDVLNLQSAFMSFDPAGPSSYAFALTSIMPGLGAAPGQALNTFVGEGTGNFEAVLSSGGGAGGVPEPATWAMLLVGVGAVGAVLRRRHHSLVPVV